MQPALRKLHIYQGDPYYHRVTFIDSDGQPLNVSGEWRSQIRERFSREESIDFTIDDSEAAQGILHLSLTEEQAKTVPQNGVWDLERIGVGTYLKGPVISDREVSR